MRTLLRGSRVSMEEVGGRMREQEEELDASEAEPGGMEAMSHATHLVWTSRPND